MRVDRGVCAVRAAEVSVFVCLRSSCNRVTEVLILTAEFPFDLDSWRWGKPILFCVCNHVTEVLILTKECSVYLDSCLLWGKPIIPWMYNHVTGVLILT